MYRHPRLFALLVILAMVISACTLAATPPPPTTPVSVQLSWTHQAQFAGIYVAAQKRYYATEGIAATFLEGVPGIDTSTYVVDGAAQFGIVNADLLIQARSAGAPLRAIATVYRRSPRVFMAMRDSGITRPEHFAGKIIQQARPGVPVLRAVAGTVGLRPDQYTIIDTSPDLDPLYSGKVHVRSVFLTNEVITARREGYQVNLIYPDDYRVHLYADTIYTTDDMIAKNPELVLRFLRATLKGWTYAMENPEEAGIIVLKYNPKADVARETDTVIASIPLVNTGEDFTGWMRPEMWSGMERTFREQGVLTTPLDITTVYTLRFVQEVYGK